MTTAHSNRDARHHQRQDEIIAAARRCVRRAGFHGTSMSQLASESQLSVGQIYRYFANKEEMVAEMVRRIVATRVAAIEGKTAAERLPRLLAWRQALNDDDDLLMLEVAAEASRNPRIADILADADSLMFDNARREVAATYPHLEAARLSACVEIIAVLIDGTAFRRLTPQKAAAAQLLPLYQQLFHQLFETDK